MQKKIKYKSNGMIEKSKVQKYGEALELIKKNNGSLTAKIVVDEAKDEKHPLHSYFDWNDKTASNKWRLHQARMLIANITEVVVVKGKNTECRGFFSVTRESGDQEYVSLKDVTENIDYTQQVLDKIIRHLEVTTDLLSNFKELVKKKTRK